MSNDLLGDAISELAKGGAMVDPNAGQSSL